jgi:DNA-binding transcriptional LysR family regulator
VKRIVVSWAVLGAAALLVAFAPLPHSLLFQPNASSGWKLETLPTLRPFCMSTPGDKVTIELVSTDVVHGLYVDGYDISVTADPGQPASLTFTADRPGTFRLRCSVTCGALHPFMVGKLQVGSNLLFWRGIGLAFVRCWEYFLFVNPHSLNTGH